MKTSRIALPIISALIMSSMCLPFNAVIGGPNPSRIHMGQSDEKGELRLGKTVSGTINPGETHRYSLKILKKDKIGVDCRFDFRMASFPYMLLREKGGKEIELIGGEYQNPRIVRDLAPGVYSIDIWQNEIRAAEYDLYADEWQTMKKRKARSYSRFDYSAYVESQMNREKWTKWAWSIAIPAAYLGLSAFAREAGEYTHPEDNPMASVNATAGGAIAGGLAGGLLLGLMGADKSSGSDMFGNLGSILLYGFVGVIGGAVGGGIAGYRNRDAVGEHGLLYYGAAGLIAAVPFAIIQIDWR